MIFDGRKAIGIKTATRTLRADAVVVNADFAEAMRRMVPNKLRRKWTDERIASKRFSCSTFMMYLGIEGRYEDLAHHTIYLSKDYQQNLRDIERDHVLSNDPSFYVQNACVTDPGLAPKGNSTLYVLAPVTHQTPNVDWPKEQAGFRARVIEQLSKVGIEGLEERIRFEKIISPLDWKNDYALHQGATFSMAHSLRQMLHLRPHNRFEDLDGVYLVGGGTHPGSGLPVIFESARITSRLLLEDMNVQPMWAEQPAMQTAPMYEAAS
jgi:phytoene desaturase